MRRSNEHAILTHLWQEPGQPGSVIARKTGLAPQTVSVLLRQLEQDGLIAREPVLRGRRGQPAVPFRLRSEAAQAIGVDLNWQHCDFVLLDLGGQVIHGERLHYRWPDPETIVDQIIAGIQSLMQRVAKDGNRLLGVGLTNPSGLAERAFVLGASNETCEQLGAIDFVDEIATRTGLAVFRSNDGISAMWAELALNRPSGEPLDCAYVFVSTFIGSALCVDGRVLAEDRQSVPMIGAAMTQLSDGRSQALHRSCSLWSLAGFLSERGHKVDAHDLASWDWDAIEPDFAAWLEDAARALAFAFANTSAIAGVSALILDGDLPRCVLARLINIVQARINDLPIEVFGPPLVMLGNSGPSAPAIGAAYRLLHERFFAD